jgi:hypothetical protein
MALPGMKSTADFAADERPKNWREGIALLMPRNGASLFALTSAMQSASTDDPEFYWWEESAQMHNFVVNGAQTNVDTTIEVAAGALQLKPSPLPATPCSPAPAHWVRAERLLAPRQR